MFKTTLVLAAFVLSAVCANAQAVTVQENPLEKEILTPVKHHQRLQNRQTSLWQETDNALEKTWADGKKALNKIGLDVGVDVSYLAQRSAPGGKQTAIQGVYYPYLTWDLFKNHTFGAGQLNVNYTFVRYWGTQATYLQGRSLQAVAFNDYAGNQEFFSQLSYTHTLPGDLNWLSVTVGQYPLYNFDGTTYLDNQQTALINFALSQNASSVYPAASLGAYVQAQTKNFTLAAGYQDATNITGEHIEFGDAFSGKYTGFGYAAWTPTFDIGAGQYSVLYYAQPSVEEQPQHANGWSVNVQQNIGKSWALFARANGSTGGISGVKNSYAGGVALLNPFKRNSQDALILGMAYNRLSNSGQGDPAYMRPSETAVELAWVWGIGKLITITPDVQLYPRTALNDKKQFATVVGLRTTVQL
ncbi:MAG: carbohydrate porin [Elusimicrobiaceae bacterium]|nr:carbohydrate porin [Elusimicrobiaceae bacterium]MBP5617480.1 carbohydrate porin [Elusimicrobiaceae bacterium]